MRSSDWVDELRLAWSLADAADAVSVPPFRSADLRRSFKDDGTPVAQVDFDVEDAMRRVLVETRPGDRIVGEEIGGFAGTTGRCWMFDGIDGTHNYAAGRPGWCTAITLLVGDEPVVAVVTAPKLGRRWWATNGGGAWSSSLDDPADAQRVRCSDVVDLDAARCSIIPWEGMLVGWRNRLEPTFGQASDYRVQSIVLDIVAAATGEIDLAVMGFGEPWDYAGTTLIVTEAGGVHRDAWGGTSFDHHSQICGNPALVAAALDRIAELRPGEPDRAVLARTTSRAIGTPDEQADDPWRTFGLRPMPSMSARSHVTNAPPEVLNIVDERAALLAEPLRGITTDGTVRSGLRRLDDAPRVATAPITAAAAAFLVALTAEQRVRATFPLGATEWRTWINVHMNHFRHGVLLEDLPLATRRLGLDIVRATLSARGFTQARTIMRINELLAEISGDREAFGEWPYFLSVFGTPGDDAPWGWQLDGHHLCLNALVLDGRIVMTPAFMGAEPRDINRGPLAGTFLFGPEEAAGLALVRSLDADQRARTIIHPSIDEGDISPLLQNMFDGRMQAGAFRDNAVMPPQGIAGTELTDAQRRRLVDLAAAYVGWQADGHAAVKLSEVERHLDETWFSWYGGTDDVRPFYYRVHSPVVLIEFDHHPGVVLDNESPTRHHVHTVVRTPNGGDYGADLLAQHHERYDHTNGTHTPHH